MKQQSVWRQSTGAMFASVLVHERRITAPQAVATLTEKTVEDLCDIFLWTEGSFSFEPRPPGAKAALNINLDPIHVVHEGIRRAELWNRMNAYIHLGSFYERTDEPMERSGTWEDWQMAQEMWRLVDENQNVGDLLEKLPFSRYKIYRALAELLEHRLICGCDVTAVFNREKRFQKKFQEARAAAEAGRWTEAMETLQGLASANPGREDVLRELLSATRGFERSVYEHNFTKEDIPVVTIGLDAQVGLNLAPNEAFLLSRVDGRLSVREVLRITPISELEGLRAFKRLLSAKVIDFPRLKAIAEQPLPPV